MINHSFNTVVCLGMWVFISFIFFGWFLVWGHKVLCCILAVLFSHDLLHMKVSCKHPLCVHFKYYPPSVIYIYPGLVSVWFCMLAWGKWPNGSGACRPGGVCYIYVFPRFWLAVTFVPQFCFRLLVLWVWKFISSLTFGLYTILWETHYLTSY